MIWLGPSFGVSHRVVTVDHVYKHTAGRYLMEPRLLGLLVAILTMYANGGAYALQYTTFEDLDMLDPWPVSHVGVLVNTSDGSLWVIHNNGGGTYSMAWSEYKRVWSTHRVQLSEWRYAAPGCTVEEAVRRCSPRYDLLLDNCYTARDTVVRYFSDIGTFPFQTCFPNRTYCGYQLDQKLLGPGLVTSVERGIFRCRNDRVVADAVSTCSHECTSSGDDAFCRCSSGKTYCGHELYGQGWTGYQRNTLYLCLEGGQNATAFSSCQEDRCQGSIPGTGAHCPCTPGRAYSGHDLYLMGLMSIKADTDRIRLARCTNGSHAVWIDDCVKPHAYCGYELAALGWLGYDKDALYQCLGGRNASHVKICETGCVKTTTSSYCAQEGKCEANRTYCGRTLMELGWNESESDTIYLCESDGKNTTTLVHCSDTCVQQHHAFCPCHPGHAYCGRDLYEERNWWRAYNVMLPWLQWRGHCTNGSNIEWTSKCTTGCITQEYGSYCACEVNKTYCGHRLPAMGLVGYDNNSLYICDSGGQVSHLQSCPHGCGYNGCLCAPGQTYCGSELVGWAKYEDLSTHQVLYWCMDGSRTKHSAVCLTGCISHDSGSYCACETNATYCGQKLHNMGWRGYDNSTLYRCHGGSNNLTSLGKSQLCESCIIGRSYCGHELQHSQHAAERDLQVRYMCNHDGSLKRTARCTTCVNHGKGAYCRCIPGSQHCGREVYSSGWQGYRETRQLPPEFTNDTLFQCKDEETIEPVEQCAKGECRESQWGDSAYCLCTPGQTYCGHELYIHYNSQDTYLYSHNIYQCSASKLVVKVVDRCGTCVSIGGTPRCQAECLVNRYYCGNKLLSLEGWKDTDLQPNGLYTCANGTTALLVQNCTAGCQLDDEDSDAYCSGEPPPW